MSYQPKLNLEMVRLGYIGADPKLTGLTGGYQLRQTTGTAPQQKQTQKQDETNGRRPNPYLK